MVRYECASSIRAEMANVLAVMMVLQFMTFFDC